MKLIFPAKNSKSGVFEEKRERILAYLPCDLHVLVFPYKYQYQFA